MTIIKKIIALSLSLLIASNVNAWSFSGALSSVANWIAPAKQYPDLTEESADSHPRYGIEALERAKEAAATTYATQFGEGREAYIAKRVKAAEEAARVEFDTLSCDGDRERYVKNAVQLLTNDHLRHKEQAREKATIESRLACGFSRLMFVTPLAFAAYSAYKGDYCSVDVLCRFAAVQGFVNSLCWKTSSYKIPAVLTAAFYGYGTLMTIAMRR